MTAGRASAGFLRGTCAAVGPLRLPVPGQTARCSAMATITLIQQAVQVLPGVSIRTGEPRVGAHYVGLPLTLRGQ
jgi:hypothetical protein